MHVSSSSSIYCFLDSSSSSSFLVMVGFVLVRGIKTMWQSHIDDGNIFEYNTSHAKGTFRQRNKGRLIFSLIGIELHVPSAFLIAFY